MKKSDYTHLPSSWIWIVNIIKMMIIPKAMHKVNVIPIKLSITFFTDLQKKKITIFMETQKTGIVKAILINKNRWRHQRTWLQVILQSYSHQDSMVQFSSVQSLSSVRLCDPMNYSMPGLPVHHQLPQFTQTHVHQVRDTIQPSHPLSSPSPPVPNPSQHQSLFQWLNPSHEVAKVLEFQL